MRGLITGATSGIGRGYAIEFAKLGYDLIITGRREKQLYELRDMLIGSYGVEVEVVIADFTNKEQMEKVIDVAKLGGLDLLINNVGYGNKEGYFEGSYERVEAMVEVHVNALTKLIWELVPIMNSGYIINVSSLASFLPTPYNNLYGGTKAFINIFTESLYLNLKKRGIKVQLLLPSFTYTDFHEKIGIDDRDRRNRGLIRWMKVEDVVEYSINSLGKNSCLCIPGFINRFMYQLFKFVPKRLYYRFAEKEEKI